MKTTETTYKPSAFMLAVGALCRPDETRLCSECLAPVIFGEVTCGKPACVASLSAFLYPETKCIHEDDGGPFFAKCRKCGIDLDDYAGGD